MLKKLPNDCSDNDLKNFIQYVTKQKFDLEHRLTLEQAISEILENAEFDEKVKIAGLDLFQTYKRYQKMYEEIKKQYHNLEKLSHYIMETRISKINRAKGIAMKVRLFNSNLERVAAAVFTVNSYFRIELREVQVLALILARLSRRASVSRILQMQTGEGKTYVVAALAVYEVLNGNKVDVITSSSELAVNQYNELFKFYTSIGLTVAHNANNKASEDHSGIAALEDLLDISKALRVGLNIPVQENYQVYQADVVYGAASDFMGDVLREEFEGSDLRYRRGFQVAIVDEVDSMLLDGRNDSVRLASSSPGMGYLLGIKAGIWQLINVIHCNMKKENGIWYCDEEEEGMRQFNSDGELYEYVKERTLEFMKKTLDLAELTEEEKKGDSDWDLKVEKDNTNNEIKLPFPKIEYPLWLKSFVENQLPKWVESAVKARFFMEPNFDYIIQNNKLVVVDAANTGVHHPTMQWGHGLHQFLQMKHALEVQPESLPTNYISNVAFFLRYKREVLGLTGTIGGNSSRTFLRSVYGTDFVDIPPFMKRRHLSLKPQICSGRNWLDTVVKTTTEKMKLGRAVLLITQYIHHAEEIHKSLKEIFKNRVKMYTSKDTNQVLCEEIQAGTCIVATNIAGRGTDLKVSNEVLATGGLHVLLTVLPETDRVERQNIGRTSRIGQVGTSQIILNTDHLPAELLEALLDRLNKNSTQETMLESLREARDDRSMKTVSHALEDRKKTEKADETLIEYISLRQSLCSAHEEIKRKCLDARLGRYLAKAEVIDKEDMKKEFQGTNDYIDTPSGAVLFAQQHFGSECTPGSLKYQAAFDYLCQAVKLDDKYCAAGYYFRAALRLDSYKKNNSIRDVDDAIKDFELSKQCLERMKLQYEILIQATVLKKDQEREEAKTLVIHQMEKHIIVCDTIIKNIEAIIGRNITEDLKYYETAIKIAKKENKDYKELDNQYNMLKKNRYSIEHGVLRETMKTGNEITIKPQKLEEALPDSEIKFQYTDILQYFRQEGFGTLIVVCDRPPINWWAVAAVAGAALLQIVGGITATIFSVGAGARLGLALLQEGIGDAIYAIKNGIFERNINWASYGYRKAISLAITFVTLGWGAIKGAGRGMVRGAKAGMSLLKGAGNKLTQEGWRLAVKKTAEVAVKEVTKVVLFDTFDYFCGEAANTAVSKVIQEACYQVVKPMLCGNVNLRKIVEWDNNNGNKQLRSKFIKLSIDPLRVNQTFLNDVSTIVGKLAGQGFKKAGVGEAAECIDNAIKMARMLDIYVSLAKFLTHIPQILIDLVKENADKNETPVEKHEHRGYLELKSTVEDVLHALSGEIATFYSSQIISFASSALISKFVEYNMSDLWNVNSDLSHFRFIDSEEVAKRATAMKAMLPEGTIEGAVLDKIVDVENGGPGDIIQAEQLAIAAKCRIEIELPNGEIKVFGAEYTNSVVKMTFTPGENGEIGHYSLADGTEVCSSGKYSCLFDAVAKRSGYDAALLRKATANFMLHNLDNITDKYLAMDWANLMVGGQQNTNQRKRSPSPARKVRHVAKVNTMGDLMNELTKMKIARANRKKKNSISSHTLNDEDSEDFDRNVIQSCGVQGALPGSTFVFTNAQTMIYEAEYDNQKNIIAIRAYQGQSQYLVDSTTQQAFHWTGTLGTPQKITLWSTGQEELPQDTVLEDLYNRILNP